MNENILTRNLRQYQQALTQMERHSSDDGARVKATLCQLSGTSTDIRILKRLSSQIRRIDDKAGLVSKSAGPLSACAGARFRTTGFMKTDMRRRSGAKADSRAPYGVHIEHTIPVSVRRTILLNSWRKGQLSDIDAILIALDQLRIGTAMTREEERGVVRLGWHHKHPDLNQAATHAELALDQIHPFRRYTPDVEIWDMSTGVKVDHDVTLDMLMNP